MQAIGEQKRYLYQLIMNQLIQDGYIGNATSLSESALIPLPSIPKHKQHGEDQIQNQNESGISEMNLPSLTPVFSEDRLWKLVQLGLQKERELNESGGSNILPGENGLLEEFPSDVPSLDFTNTNQPRQKFPMYVTKYITTHKNTVRTAKFSPDGKLIATGSSDTSIKLLDAAKMKNYNQVKLEHGEDYAPARPMARTFYDHTQAINDVEFHPASPILISCSKDCTIKFYDFSQPNAKRSFRYIQDAYNIRSVNFHPCGDFIISGTEDPVLRLYDVNTLDCFTCSRPQDHHLGPINQVRYSPLGNLFASCSKDGSIKLWDSVTNRVVNTIMKAHAGYEPTTVQFSRNQRYLLSAGKDGTIRVWELSTGKQVQHIITGTQWKNRLHATFTHNEELIACPEENAFTAVLWDTKSGECLQRLSGHTNVIRWIASSPVEPLLLTCSNDHRARLWAQEQ